MTHKLKVYGWTSFHRTGGQVRKIIAATSWTEASRLSGCRMSELRFCGSITGNDQEIALATAKPGTLFYVPINEPFKTYREYREEVRKPE
jgi:hypothetical protein